MNAHRKSKRRKKSADEPVERNNPAVNGAALARVLIERNRFMGQLDFAKARLRKISDGYHRGSTQSRRLTADEMSDIAIKCLCKLDGWG